MRTVYISMRLCLVKLDCFSTGSFNPFSGHLVLLLTRKLFGMVVYYKYVTSGSNVFIV